MLITLDEAREQLGFEEGENEDDGLLDAIILGISSTWDDRHGIVADRQERSFTFDRFQRLIVIPALPVDVETIEISYLDGSGVAQPVTDFRAAPLGKHTRILPAIGASWPATACGEAMVTVTATVGWSDDPLSSDAVPAGLKVAARMMLAHLFNNREAWGAKLEETPGGVGPMLDPFLRRRV